MPSLSLGPLNLALDRLIAVAAIWIFLASVAAIGRRTRERGEPAALYAALAGLVAARGAFVAAHWADFAASPLSVFSVWQGGFAAWAGIMAAALVLVAMLRGSRARGLSLAALGAVSAAAIAALWIATPAPAPLPPVAPLARLSGAPLDLASLKGKPFVVNLWATWCPPCRRELPMLAAEAARGKVPILLVDQGEDTAKVTAFLAREGIAPDAVLLDPAMQLSQAVNARGYPVTLFIDARGMIVQSHMGEIGAAGLADGMDAITKDDT